MSLTISGNQFMLNGAPTLLRGVGLAGRLNLEHFLIGIPGTESEIRRAVVSVYGEEKARLFWRTYYENNLAGADVRFLKSLGFNCVRLPINFRAFDAPGEAFEESEAVLEMERVISLCEQHGLLCVIDLHAAPGGQNPDWHCDNATGDYLFFKDERFRAETVSLWTRIAAHFKDRASIGGYDLINEPHYFEKSLDDVLMRFYADCIEAIRREDDQTVIFLEGKTYGRDFSMMKHNLDDNVAYSFHYYPFLQLPGRLNDADAKRQIRESLFRDVTLEHLLENLGRPIWCGETGHPLHEPDTVGALGDFLEILEEMDISWSLWPHKDARAMALCFLNAKSRFLSLTRQASLGWNFWDSFNQDTTLAAENEPDKHAFYRKLAAASTEANERFLRGLKSIPFETLIVALEDWTLEACEKNESLIQTIPRSNR